VARSCCVAWADRATFLPKPKRVPCSRAFFQFFVWFHHLMYMSVAVLMWLASFIELLWLIPKHESAELVLSVCMLGLWLGLG